MTRSTLDLYAKKMGRPFIFWLSLLVIFLWLVWSLLRFSSDSYRHMEQLSKQQLREVALQTAYSIQIKMKDYEDSIQALAHVFSSYDTLHSFETLTLVEKITKGSGFDRIRITTPDGKSYAAPGNMIDITDRDYFENAMAGRSGISDIMVSLYNNTTVFVVYAPLRRNDKIIGTIHGAVEVNLLSDAINLTSFGGNGYIHLFQQDGGIILESANAAEIQKNFENIWEFFKTAPFSKEYDIDVVQKDVKNKRSGFLTYYQDDRNLLGYYTPVGINDWYLMQVLPASLIAAQNKPLNGLSLILVIKVIAVFFLLTLVLLFFERRFQRSLLNVNREMGIRNELLRIAVSHTSNYIFEYDLLKGIFSFSGDKQPPYGLSRVMENGLESILSHNIIASESVEDFKGIFEDMRRGKKSAEATLKLTYGAKPSWMHIILTNVFDQNGHPIYTIGTADDVTKEVLSKLRYSQEDQYRRAMLKDNIRVYEINVSQGKFRKLEASLDDAAQGPWITYMPEINRLRNSIVHPEDWEIFTEISDRTNLMRAYEEGLSDLYCEYRTVTPSNETAWVLSNTHLLLDPSTGDVKAFTYASDITARKEQEARLRQRAERDSLTQLYNRDAAKNLIRNVLNNSDFNCLHGFLSIDLDQFKDVNDNFGHIAGDTLLKAVADSFGNFVRSGDVLARMGGDEFILFLRDIRTLSNIELVAARMCECIRWIEVTPGSDFHISCSIGIAVFSSHGTTFEELYVKSDSALYTAKNQGKNCYTIYSNNEVNGEKEKLT